MKKKILITITTLILVILPFLIATAIGKYSPYIEGNSFQRYVIICSFISIVIVSLVLLLMKYFFQSFESVLIGGVLLFLLLCPIVGIFGLASAPDLSLKMLEHPEREHLRYSFLFIAAILFGVFALLLLMSDSSQIKKSTKWIVSVVFILAFAEFIWEFNHHYLYPEGLKEWVSQGKSVETFERSYDNTTIVNIGVFGRLIQFSLIIWLSLHLYKLRQIKIWSPILSIFFSLIGIVSATFVYFIQFNFPKGFEILMLFFIPGIPFFLLYWLGVALLTKFKKSEIAA